VLAARRRNETLWPPAVCVAVVAGFIVAAPRAARPAALTVEAPASCIDPAALSEAVVELVGTPIASVPDVDFRIQIAGTAHQRWRLRVETLDHQPAGVAQQVRGTRELEAGSCAELAEAAALAIAVSLRAVERPGSTAASTVEPARLSPPAPAIRSVPLPAGKVPWRAGAGLAVVVESGVLPHLAPGLQLEADLNRGALRLALRGEYFGAQDTLDSAATGGSFQLVDGDALGCFLPVRDHWSVSVCAGLALGRLAGTGLNVARPHTRSALWGAGRAEAGVARRVGADAALFLRAGLAAPFIRPAFVLDESQLVHRPDRLAGNLAAGMELGF